MRIVLLLAVLILPGAGAWADDRRTGGTDGGLQVRIGDWWAQDPDRPDDRRRTRLRPVTRDDGQAGDERRPRRGHWRPSPPRYVIIERDRDPEPPDEAPAPPDAPAAADPAATVPDPAGSMGRYPARGRPQPRRWVPGQVLPRDLPHVKLAHDRYGLPAPPPGQIYARVRGDVLLIDETTRKVMSHVTP